MNNVEFWTEVVSIIKHVMDSEEELDMFDKDTLERVFERANNELIVATNEIGGN